MLDIVTGIILKPVETFRQIKGKKLFWLATLVLIVSLSPVWNISNTEVWIGRPTAIVLFEYLVGSLLGFVSMGIYALIVFPISRLINGTGSFLDTYQALGFSVLPCLFTAPVMVLRFLTASLGFLTSVLDLIELGLICWTIVLGVIALREVHQLTTGRAVSAYVSPFVVLFLLLGLVVFIITLVAGSLIGM
ncbi:MAG: hypothetical protein GX020_03945 [Firmicutes bacterium]|nr:hypothetical protein [Bacillota bacterium]